MCLKAGGHIPGQKAFSRLDRHHCRPGAGVWLDLRTSCLKHLEKRFHDSAIQRRHRHKMPANVWINFSQCLALRIVRRCRAKCTAHLEKPLSESAPHFALLANRIQARCWYLMPFQTAHRKVVCFFHLHFQHLGAFYALTFMGYSFPALDFSFAPIYNKKEYTAGGLRFMRISRIALRKLLIW